MQFEDKKLINEFEREIWLYLDESLPSEKKKYWDLKLSESPELRSIYEKVTQTLSVYDQLEKEAVPDIVLEKMIVKVTSEKKSVLSLFETLNSKIENLLIPKFSFFRLAFGLAILAGAIAVSVLFTKPDPIPELSDEMLSWNPRGITYEIDDIEKSILNQNYDWKNYWARKIVNDDWSKQVFTIEQKINQISRDVDFISPIK